MRHSLSRPPPGLLGALSPICFWFRVPPSQISHLPCRLPAPPSPKVCLRRTCFSTLERHACFLFVCFRSRGIVYPSGVLYPVITVLCGSSPRENFFNCPGPLGLPDPTPAPRISLVAGHPEFIYHLSPTTSSPPDGQSPLFRSSLPAGILLRPQPSSSTILHLVVLRPLAHKFRLVRKISFKSDDGQEQNTFTFSTEFIPPDFYLQNLISQNS